MSDHQGEDPALCGVCNPPPPPHCIGIATRKVPVAVYQQEGRKWRQHTTMEHQTLGIFSDGKLRKLTEKNVWVLVETTMEDA